ncbi:MAG: recombinase family protein [Legionellales bacterium]|nr:recombinase family protein [Legionellales bacterium]
MENLVKKSPQTIAYLRVSTIDQDIDKNKADILHLANNLSLGKVLFVEEKVSGKISWRKRKIADIVNELQENDVLIVSELSRLGRSMLECMEILSIAAEKKIRIYAIKGNWHLDGSIQSKILAMAFSMAAEIERDLISKRTTEALRAKKVAGVKLGRPIGRGKSKLDQYRLEIESLLQNGASKRFVAKRYGTTSSNLHNWLNKNKLHSCETSAKGS